MNVCMEITARRRGDHWKLDDNERKMLVEALDPPLKRVPLPEKELGVIGELGALGFVCFAVFGPRIEADRAIAAAKKPPAAHAAVAEAERITAAHAERPYAKETELDGFRTPMNADDTGGELGITLGETAPTFINDVDAIAREHELTPERIVELRNGLGVEGDLLDAYPSTLLDGDGNELSRGVE